MSTQTIMKMNKSKKWTGMLLIASLLAFQFLSATGTLALMEALAAYFGIEQNAIGAAASTFVGVILGYITDMYLDSIEAATFTAALVALGPWGWALIIATAAAF